ncbi:MAG: hypothetical protein JWP17_2911 [Solirubrobacterales bacterium]|jgi:hypothetical protein|nr:hypothetical protein [Solirubrobacterales bacterium]
MIDPADACLLLGAMRDAEDLGAPLYAAALAGRLGLDLLVVTDALAELEQVGLVLPELESQPPLLLTAGRQYLERGGVIDDEALAFLALVIDDLAARRALLIGGRVLVADFREAVSEGRTLEHAQALVPPAFAPAIGEGDALDLFACSIALMARLSADEPAACVGEEIVAVGLLDEARSWIEAERDRDALTEDEADNATNELRALFDLFSDDDVLELFTMREPSDAAVAGHRPDAAARGIVDQRLEAWFVAFGGVAVTGHLRPRE